MLVLFLSTTFSTTTSSDSWGRNGEITCCHKWGLKPFYKTGKYIFHFNAINYKFQLYDYCESCSFMDRKFIFFLLDSDKIAGCPIVACTVRQWTVAVFLDSCPCCLTIIVCSSYFISSLLLSFQVFGSPIIFFYNLTPSVCILHFCKVTTFFKINK